MKKLMTYTAIVLAASSMAASSALAFDQDILGDPEVQWFSELIEGVKDVFGIDAPSDGEPDIIDGDTGEGEEPAGPTAGSEG